MASLTDSTNRRINYLRISVTDKCNFRCGYCMPAGKVEWKPREQILRLEEIAEIVREGAGLGISKVRISGGEPLMRKNLEFLVGAMAEIPGLEEISMTTNGALLTSKMALSLKRAGLQRVNISLDTLDAVRFREITANGSLQSVLAGMDAALASGLTPVKINMVVFPETTDEEIRRMRAFCGEKGAVLQTIGKFSLKKKNGTSARHTDRPLPCEDCNRLRLTADGFLLPCLFSDKEIRVDMNAIRESFHRSVAMKPPCGVSCQARSMHQIGG